MNGKLNVRRSAKDGRIRNNQKGALLIGLIITMVIISALSGAMVYIFSSSTLNPVSGKYAQQAYYNAEAGFRYLTAVYRNEANSAAGRTAVITTFASPKTITLPSGGTAKVTMSPLAYIYTPATATATLSGSDLVLSGITGSFPTAPGFFSIGTGTTVYRYLGTIPSPPVPGHPLTLTGITPSGYTGGSIQTVEHTTITSVGTYGSGSGLWNVNRKINYAWVLSGFPTGGGGQPGDFEDKFPKDFQKIVDDNPFKGTALGEFAVAAVGGPAITVVSTTGGKAEAVLGYVAEPNPFEQAWNNANKYLSYDIQIKIGTGVWVSGAFDKTAGSPNSIAQKGYMAGLTFRSTGNTPGQWDQLGLDFAKYSSTSKGNSPDNLIIYPDLIEQATSYPLYTVGWIDDRSQFYKCNRPSSAGCSVNQISGKLFPGIGWDPYDPPPMIFLWIRFENPTSGLDYWLAYMQLHGKSDPTENEPADGIVNGDGLLKDWSTIMLRVVEGASLRFNSSTTGFAVGDIVSNDSGASGKVFKKIQYNNPVSGTIQDVIILNNVTGTFATGNNISSPPNQTTAIANVEYRARDNYIWAMFGDTDAHGTADTTAINNTRRVNARIVSQADHNSINATNMNCYFHWPEMNIADWGIDIVENCPTPQTVKNDYFKLVRWDALNPAAGSWSGPKISPVKMLIMGTGKEAGAILRTDKWTTGLYTTPFPYEIGFHSIGTSATKTYFDDLAINFPGQYIPRSTQYVPPSQY